MGGNKKGLSKMYNKKDENYHSVFLYHSIDKNRLSLCTQSLEKPIQNYVTLNGVEIRLIDLTRLDSTCLV